MLRTITYNSTSKYRAGDNVIFLLSANFDAFVHSTEVRLASNADDDDVVKRTGYVGDKSSCCGSSLIDTMKFCDCTSTTMLI